MSQPPYQSGDTSPGNWGLPPQHNGSPAMAPSYTRPSGVPQSPAHEYSADPYGGQPYGQQPYGGQPYGAQPGGWHEQPYGYQGYDPYGEPPHRGNGMAVAGFVLSFFGGLLGLIFSIIGLKRSKEPGRGRKGLAIAGIVISIVSMAFWTFVAAEAAKQVKADDAALNSALAGTSSSPSTPVPAAGSTTVAGACKVILPAITGLQSQMQAASSPADMVNKINQLADTIRQQGVASGDAAFTRDTAAMADSYRTFLQTLQKTGKPDIQGIYKTSEQIGFDCAQAGVTP